jgi:hypothetical protein
VWLVLAAVPTALLDLVADAAFVSAPWGRRTTRLLAGIPTGLLLLLGIASGLLLWRWLVP